ncbi:PRTRC system ThiF family protein [Motilimonas eburnea]|uniref:PRTRC system ThiF family protein n=1 Tax=Motilimonas eburnea TaxID=1737488 RepID=UPI001E4F6A0E|nr:PRTRC system ThiF family protein [Motilimonas eburnea]MCE2571720.1 PRTRC system ThiF family protein [Motilimonas eburnea]
MKLTMPNDWVNGAIKITVAGAGGTGAALLTELFQMDSLIRSLSNEQRWLDVTVYDDACVSPANLGRQSFWAADVGRPKAEVLVNRINQWGGVKWSYVIKKFQPRNLDTRKTELIITAVDVPSVRRAIGEHYQFAKEGQHLWLDFGNGKDQSQCVIGHIAKPNNTNRVPNFWHLYKDHLATMIDDTSRSCSTEQAIEKQDYGVNKSIVLFGCQLLWQILRYGETKYFGCFQDLTELDCQGMLIDKQTIASFGVDVDQFYA